MKKRHVVPSLITIGNLFCGFLAISYVMDGRLVQAGWLIVIAAFLDAMDGKIARAMRTPSRFGVEFDSLADVCSFGLAPAALIYSFLSRTCGLDETWAVALSFLFLLCGGLRLARFNSQQKGFEKKNITGLPIPSASSTLVAFVIFSEKVWSGPATLEVSVILTILLSLLMVSTLEYDSFPKLAPGSWWNRVKLGYFLTGAVLTVLYAEEVFFPLAITYAMSGVVRRAVMALRHRPVAERLDDAGPSF